MQSMGVLVLPVTGCKGTYFYMVSVEKSQFSRGCMINISDKVNIMETMALQSVYMISSILYKICNHATQIYCFCLPHAADSFSVQCFYVCINSHYLPDYWVG